MNNRKQNILSNFDALSAEKKQFVMLAMSCVMKSDVKPLKTLLAQFSDNAEMVAVLNETIQHIEAKATPTPRYTYTDLSGEIITVETLEWLEDGTYWESSESRSIFDDDYDYDLGDNRACSRYSIGVDENGDGISVWLNDDMQEVEV